MVGFYSKVANVAVQIGADVLEVSELDEYFNKEIIPPTSSPPSNVGGRPLTVTSSSNLDKYKIKLEPDEGDFFVEIQRYRFSEESSLSVAVLAYPTGFTDSVGMSGSFLEPGIFLRNGTEVTASEGTMVGESWQGNVVLKALLAIETKVCARGPSVLILQLLSSLVYSRSYNRTQPIC